MSTVALAAPSLICTRRISPLRIDVIHRLYQGTDSGTHDVGFIIFGSFGNGVELGRMGDEYVTVLDRAAHTLATRWSPKVGMIRSWGAIDDEKEFEVRPNTSKDFLLLYSLLVICWKVLVIFVAVRLL